MDCRSTISGFFEGSKVNINMLTTYDTLVYYGSLHAVGINGVKFISKNINKLKNKRLVVFASGLLHQAKK
jgi:hypothetical protein